MKKILIITASLVCTFTVYLTHTSSNNEYGSDLITKNIEALTQSPEVTQLWFRVDSDCEYIFKGRANSTAIVSIPGIGNVTASYDRDGEWSYLIKKGATNCTAGGHEQCTARYCN